jgi:hypothetical protein
MKFIKKEETLNFLKEAATLLEEKFGVDGDGIIENISFETWSQKKLSQTFGYFRDMKVTGFTGQYENGQILVLTRRYKYRKCLAKTILHELTHVVQIKFFKEFYNTHKDDDYWSNPVESQARDSEKLADQLLKKIG